MPDAERPTKPKRQTPGLFHHFVRTTPRLAVDGRLKFGRATIETWTAEDARRLALKLHGRTVFARHSWERDGYVRKAESMTNASVLEFMLPGDHQLTADGIRRVGDEYERLLLLTAAYGQKREFVQQSLGISKHGHEDEAIDLLISANMQHVSTSTKRSRSRRGLVVDAVTVRRAGALGLTDTTIATLVNPVNDIGRRAQMAMRWLEQSVLEPDEASATVKCSVGFETLLVFSEGEPVARPVGERLAFLLGEDAAQRASLASEFTSFYRLRSAIVHGDPARVVKARARTDPDRMRRILLLATVEVAARATDLRTNDEMREWFDGLRWTSGAKVPNVSFRRSLLRKLLPKSAPSTLKPRNQAPSV